MARTVVLIAEKLPSQEPSAAAKTALFRIFRESRLRLGADSRSHNVTPEGVRDTPLRPLLASVRSSAGAPPVTPHYKHTPIRFTVTWRERGVSDQCPSLPLRSPSTQSGSAYSVTDGLTLNAVPSHVVALPQKGGGGT